MAGFNSHEGNLVMGDLVKYLLAMSGLSIDDGIGHVQLTELIGAKCANEWAVRSPELCAYFLETLYDFNSLSDDKQRAQNLSTLFSKYKHR